MKKLTKSTLDEAKHLIEKEGRKLEKYRFKNFFQKSSEDRVEEELRTYQNEDGGFGNALEPDFRLPDSSPLATSIGLRYLGKVDTTLTSEDMIESAIRYLEQTFDKDRKIWFSVPKKVNQYPHTWWWHYDKEDGMTIIDKNWGNPSAEIIGYLYKYRNYTKIIDVDRLIDHAINYIRKKDKFESENEVYCFIHLYEEVSRGNKKRLENHISRAVEQLVVYDEDKWDEYVPKPLDFVDHPDKNKFDIEKAKIEKNLEFVVDKLEKDSILEPSWDTSVYKDKMEPAYNEWKGILTLEALKILNNYELIE